MILYLQSAAAGSTRFTVVNDGASATGYELLQGTTFGSPVWDHTFSAPRGTQGARASQGRLPNREIALMIRVAGSTKDDLAAKLSALAEVVDDLRRFGGRCRWRSRSQTRFQSGDVLTANLDLPTWDNRLEQRLRAVVMVRLVCGPYMLGDPMDFTDDFTIDNVNAGDALYTADAGALTNVAVTGGVLDAAANLTTENRLIYTGAGYTYGDHEGTIEATPGSTITGWKAGVVLKRIDGSNYLEVYVDDTGAASRLRIDKVVATVRTNLASTNLAARVVNGTRLWIRGRIEGNVVFAEHFLTTNTPTPTVAPTTSTSYVLTTTEAATFGTLIEGLAGIVFTPQQTASLIDRFEVLPFTYRNPPMYAIDCHGAIPGDAPSLAEARMAHPSGLTLTSWAMLAWSERSEVENILVEGDFDDGVYNWSSAAVAGVTGAATSFAVVTSATVGFGARYGVNMGQIVTPATANTGATHAMYRRFRRGITYTATAWLRSNAGTTTARIRLGVSGDIASSTAVALSSAWTLHTATWTPTADVDLAYFAAEVTAATVTTFQIDAVNVYRGASAPNGIRAEGQGGVPPLAVIPAESYKDFLVSTAPVRTADATANGGFSLADSSVLAAGETYTLWWIADTTLIPPDDYSSGVSFEVWARVMLSGAFTGGVTATLQAFAGDANTDPIYSSEFGSVGRTLPAVTGNSKWRMTRLGTLQLGHDRWKITVRFVIAAGTNLQAFAIDDIYVVPARSRFLHPTGKTSSGYPEFLNLGNSTRTVASDLSSIIAQPGATWTSGGVGGSLLELPSGLVSILGIGTNLIPDDPTVTATSDTMGFPSTHLAVTPRWHWLREP